MESIQELFEIFVAAVSMLSIIWPIWLIAGVSPLVKITYKLYQKLRLSKANIQQIDEMDGKEFEDYLAVLFRKLGYRVRETPYQGDFGGDLVIRKDGDKSVVQAKRYNRSVGVQAVQQVVAAKEYYKCTNAMVVTNSDYTKQAVKPAKANKVELWNRNKLVSAILSVKGKAMPKGLPQADSQAHAMQNLRPPVPQNPDPQPMATSNPRPIENRDLRGGKRYSSPVLKENIAHRTIPQGSCRICGKFVPQRVIDYCRSQRNALNGEIYCFEHLDDLQKIPMAVQPVESPSRSSSLNQTL